jgi:hypothetical protein
MLHGSGFAVESVCTPRAALLDETGSACAWEAATVRGVVLRLSTDSLEACTVLGRGTSPRGHVHGRRTFSEGRGSVRKVARGYECSAPEAAPSEQLGHMATRR